MAMAMAYGRRINPENVARLVDDANATIAEFGAPTAEAQEVLGGPLATERARTEYATTALRRTGRRLAERSPFYSRRLTAANVTPDQLDVTSLRSIPVTTKRDLLERPGDFLCTDVTPFLATRTTGTTGRPAEIWLSRYEMELWPAMGALAGVLRRELLSDDLMQINMSSRSTAAMHLAAGSCRVAGIGCRPLGIVEPDEALDSLASGGATLLATVPSYLAELVTAAGRRGMGAGDFQLRRVTAGGEVLSPSLATAAAALFGVARIEESYSMTEIIPVAAAICSHGHVHHDLNIAHTELLSLDTGDPAEPGELGTIVSTPYFPYRECMPVFRYDTRDVARCLPEGPLHCELAHIPATSHILGKADHLLRTASGDVVTPRQLVEAIEALPAHPWPARFQAAVADDGRIALTLTAAAIDGLGKDGAERHFLAAGLDVSLRIVDDSQAVALRVCRSDLHETTFTTPPALVGA
jgi:phenylacetate-CoA ligase